MKKYIPFIEILLLLTILGCSKEPNFKLNETNQYITLRKNKDNIKSLIIRYDTEGGRTCYNVSREIIDKIYNMILNITLTEKANTITLNDDDFYTFYFLDNTYTQFAFNGGNYTYKENNYNVIGYNPITENNLKEYITDCD